MPDSKLPEPSALTEDDYYTLIGHAEFLRRCRGEKDMPAYFFGLAARIGLLLGDPEMVRRAEGLANRKEPQ